MVMRDRDITKRMNWFDRQFVRAQDLADEQDRNLDREHRHNKTLHTRGVADGLGVVKSTAAGEERIVIVKAGTAYDDQGRAIVLAADWKLDLSEVEGSPPGPYTAQVHVAIGYDALLADPSTDPGVTGFTRTHERPRFVAAENPPSTLDLLLLAKVTRSTGNGHVTGVDDKPAGRPVASARLAPGSVGENEIADGAVKTRHIENLGVLSMDINDGAITEAKLARDAVTTDKLKDGAVTNAKLANGAVKTDHIQNFQVTTDKLADAAVNQFKILPNAVTEFGLRGDNNDAQDAERAVTARHIRNRNVTEPKLADDAVSERTIQKSAVTTNKIAPRQVVEAHLDDNSVGARQIIDGSVGTAEIADNAVTLGKLSAPVLFKGTTTVPAGGIQAVLVLSIPGLGARGAILLVEAFSPTVGATFEWRERSVTAQALPPVNFRIFHVVVFQNLGGADIQVNAVIRELARA